jgi:hypothetical protein
VLKEDLTEHRVYIVALCPTEDDARQIAQALDKMLV